MVSAESSHSSAGSSAPSRPDGGHALIIGPNGPLATLAQICPFLASEDRSWRAASPAREHRCGAVVPMAPLRPEVQRELCLVAAHRQCELYKAATRSVWPAGSRFASVKDRRHRPLARTTPLLLERGRPAGLISDLRSGGRLAQAGMVGLLALALLAIVVARTLPPPVLPAAPSIPAVVATADPTSTPTPQATPTATASPAPAPSRAPSPPPKALRTYRVRAGDTLIGIARRFGTTVRAIIRENRLSDGNQLRIGQVLRIP
jgi:LysM repeat protein